MENKELALQDLSLNQLLGVRSQLEEEVALFKNSFTQLRLAQQKFSSCIECVDRLHSNTDTSKECMIPVTNSLFLKGNLVNSQTVMVDIGTGYWMEKTCPEAITYYKSKVVYVSEQLAKVNEVLNEKANNLNTISAYIMHLEQQPGAAKQQ